MYTLFIHSLKNMFPNFFTYWADLFFQVSMKKRVKPDPPVTTAISCHLGNLISANLALSLQFLGIRFKSPKKIRVFLGELM